MPYLDYEFYTLTYFGKLATSETFPELLARASEIIDDKTTYKVTQNGLSTYTAFVQEQFKKAICAEIDYIINNGGLDVIDDESNSSVSLGKFSYSGNTTGSTASRLPYSATRYLTATGLLYGGIDCR